MTSEPYEVIHSIVTQSSGLALLGAAFFLVFYLGDRNRYSPRAVFVALLIGLTLGASIGLGLNVHEQCGFESRAERGLAWFFADAVPESIVSGAMVLPGAFGTFASCISLLIFGARRERK